jgi:hypothetical protein
MPDSFGLAREACGESSLSGSLYGALSLPGATHEIRTANEVRALPQAFSVDGILASKINGQARRDRTKRWL